ASLSCQVAPKLREECIVLCYRRHLMQRLIVRARFLTLFSALALVPSCSRDHGAPARDLKLGLSILTDAHEYPMGGVLRLDTRLMNPGADTAYVFDDFCWNPSNLLNIHAFD